MTNQEIQSLVKEAQNGSQLAFSKLYTSHIEGLKKYCISLTKNEFDAEELAIEAIGRAFESIAKYKGETAAFSTYVQKIAKNRFIDNCRKNKVQFCELDSNIKIVEQYSDTEQEYAARLSKLEAVLNERKKSEKEGKIDIVPIILEMRMQGKKENEIADELGVKRCVVAMSMRRLSERVQAAN